VEGCGVRPTSLRSTTRQPKSRAHEAQTRSVEGCPWAAAWLDCVKPTGSHTDPDVQAQCSCRRVCPETPDSKSDVSQHQTAGLRPRPKNFTDLHRLVHQQLRTTTDTPGRKPEDHPRPRDKLQVMKGSCIRLQIAWSDSHVPSAAKVSTSWRRPQGRLRRRDAMAPPLPRHHDEHSGQDRERGRNSIRHSK
jgi:hypothetical protein